MESSIYLRSDDISVEDISSIYVDTVLDREYIEFLKEPTPGLIIGSRGTGKTMLMKMAMKEIDERFQEDKNIAVMVSFKKAALIQSINDKYYFRQWMLSKVLFALKVKLKKLDISVSSTLYEEYFDINSGEDIQERLGKLIKIFENSWKEKEEIDIKNVNEIIDLKGGNAVSDVDYFEAFIQELCQSCGIKKIYIFFDEACHNFIPEEQREFFTLFRDLRFPNICCKAAVYPGITQYGTLQKFHDVKYKRIERDILSHEYVRNMRTILQKRLNEEEYKALESQGEILDCLIYSSSGNPRLLLKSISIALENNKKFNKQNVQGIMKDFYRNDIWDDHTKLGELYKGHSQLIDWGRNFMENEVLKSTWEKNSKVLNDSNSGQTISFIVHKDSPIQVKKAISILEYTGIIYLDKENIRYHYGLYNRYKINFGVVLSYEFRNSETGHVDPIKRYKQIVNNLDQIKPTSYGDRSKSYDDIDNLNFKEEDFNNELLSMILSREIKILDLSEFLILSMKSINIITIGDVLKADIENLKKAKGVATVRSAKIFNEAYSAAIEYIS